MTSKEALEILFASYHYDGNYQEVIEAREKLEQDLERLEILEKENQELKETLNKTRKMGLEIIEENKQLSNELHKLNCYRNIELNENKKLKQKLEQIKKLPNCDMCDEDWFSCMCLRKKIEEVLGNDLD